MKDYGRHKNHVPKGERKIRERLGCILHEYLQSEDEWWVSIIDGLAEKFSDESDPIDSCMHLAWTMPFPEALELHRRLLVRIREDKLTKEREDSRRAEKSNEVPMMDIWVKDL